MNVSSSTTEQTRHTSDVAHLTGEGLSRPFPPAITSADQGGKFLPNGMAIPFPGNTFLCHIDPRTDEHGAIGWLQDQMRDGPFGKYFTFLPPTSFHMTVFSSICGIPLGRDGWPEGIPEDTSLSEITRIFDDRITHGSCFQHCNIKPVGMFAGYSLTVAGVTSRDQSALKEARQLLQELTGIRRTDFETYRFHITLCYLKKWMPIDVAKAHLEFMENLFLTFKQRIKQIDLGRIEYCTFEDMEHFKLMKLI